jgi:hypothetical protein
MAGSFHSGSEARAGAKIVPYYATKGFGVTILRSKIDAVVGLPAMMAKRKSLRGRNHVALQVKTWAKIPGTKNVK